ncbi:MAG TPA: hypothetical protein VEX38_09545, partial [Fimbriimonadaceae bacterium]|nr:hypothetical protein [Fimbriimonadaceae bacterium]
QPEIIPQVLPAPVAANIDRYMRAVVESGTGTRAASVTGARGKTGTTSDNRDAWFCGYTDDLIGIGWVANMRYVADREPPWVYGEMSSRVFGGTVTVQLWTEVMRKAERMISRGKLIPPGERKTNTERRREPESEPVEDVPIETPAEPARDPYQQPIDSMPPMNQVPLDPPQPQDDSSVPLNGPPGVDGEPPIKTGGPGT